MADLLSALHESFDEVKAVTGASVVSQVVVFTDGTAVAGLAELLSAFSTAGTVKGGVLGL